MLDTVGRVTHRVGAGRGGPILVLEFVMPILDITLLEGRSADKKTALIKEVTEATVRALDVRPEQVRVILRELHPSHFGVAGVPKGPPDASRVAPRPP